MARKGNDEPLRWAKDYKIIGKLDGRKWSDAEDYMDSHKIPGVGVVTMHPDGQNKAQENVG